MSEVNTFEELIKEPTITGRELLKGLDEVTSQMLTSLDTAVDPMSGSTTEITNEMLVKALEKIAQNLRLQQGIITDGIKSFRNIIDNKRGEG